MQLNYIGDRIHPTMSFAFENLENAIVSAVRKNVAGKDIGVAFSGGLDSGLSSAIAKAYAKSVTLYTCGTQHSYDVVNARKLAEQLDLPWVHVPLTKGNVEIRIRDMIAATGTSDPFTVSYELQLYCVCLNCKQNIVLTGQGADEYFGGCAKFVNQSDNAYEILSEAAVERLHSVSIPCEKHMARHFGKELVYAYIDDGIISETKNIDPEFLKPKDMDSRKKVLKEIAIHLEYPYLANMKKKSSQYGSGTTDLVRAIAKEKGLMYNQYIASLYDEAMSGKIPNYRGAMINARIDPIIKERAEKILREQGLSPSEAVERFYLRVIGDEGFKDIEK